MDRNVRSVLITTQANTQRYCNMPSYKTVDILCPACNYKWDQLEDRSAIPETFTCPTCGGSEAKQVIGTPMVLQASYPDGYKRGQRFEGAKQIQKLRAQAANIDPNKRNDINKEIAERTIANHGKTNKFGE